MDDQPVDGVEIRHNPWMVGLGITPFALAPLMLLLSVITQNPAFAVPVLHLTLLGPFGLFAVWRKNPWPKRAMVQLSADAGGLTIVDRETRRSRRILREHIARGATGPAARGATLRITGRRFRLGAQLVVDDKHAAERVLSPLGLDVHQSIATFKGMSRTYVSGWRIFGLVVAMMASTVAVGVLSVALNAGGLALATPLVMLAFFVLMFAPTSIDVGADGVLYRWLGRQRYIAHDEIESVEVTVHGFGRSKRNVVVLFLRGGDPVYLPTGAPTLDGDNAALLAARIRDARDARQRGGLAPAALVRGAQSHAQWIAALRRPEAAGLRTQAPLKDDYWRVLEDASAAPLTRGAAAIALGKDLNDAERARLARAQKTVAAPKLRVVLDRSADDDDEALAELLEALDPKKDAKA